METNKELIDSLFFEAVNFAENTPASEFEKYLEYSKNLAKTFTRLIKEIDDPEEISIIKDFINTDFYLNTEFIISKPSISNEKKLRSNYGILKNHILNHIEIQGTIANQVGKPPVIIEPAENYLSIKEEDKAVFLEKLKETFIKSNPKQFAYLLISLDQMNLLNADYQKAVFNSFSNYFDKEYGSYTNFNKHWRNRNDKNLIKTIEKQINNIKFKNVIT